MPTNLIVEVRPDGFVVRHLGRSSDVLDVLELPLQLRTVAKGLPHYPMLTEAERRARDIKHIEERWKR